MLIQQGNVTVAEIMHPDTVDSGGNRTLLNGSVEPGGCDRLKNPFIWIRFIDSLQARPESPPQESLELDRALAVF